MDVTLYHFACDPGGHVLGDQFDQVRFKVLMNKLKTPYKHMAMLALSTSRSSIRSKKEINPCNSRKSTKEFSYCLDHDLEDKT